MSTGLSFAEKGKYDGAIKWYTECLRVAPRYPLAHYLRGVAWYKQGEYDKAIADYTDELRIDAGDPRVYVGRGITWNAKGQYDKAIADFTQALRAKDDSGYYYYSIKNDKYDQTTVFDPKEPSRFQEEFLRLNYADAYFNRGIAWVNKGEFAKAITDYSEAVKLNPKCDDAYALLGWLQATCPDEQYRDGKKAVENANKARQLSGGKNWAVIDTLAAAYAESGDFGKAVESQEEAIQLANKDKTAKDSHKKKMQSRLEQYKTRKPYHEPNSDDTANPRQPQRKSPLGGAGPGKMVE
jgi:tetratricopeptide (TPR) repeat protein